MTFEWDENKNTINIEKHNVSFFEAQMAFADPARIILADSENSIVEKRFYCIGNIQGKIVTVRFTIRNNNIRILGAGYWRKQKKMYESKNNL